MANQYIGQSETQATKQDIIAEVVQRELAARNPVTPTVRDVSRFAEPGAKSIDFPRTGSFEQNKISGDENAKTQKLDFVTDNLPLDQWAEVTWLIRKKDNLQSRVELEMEASRRASSAHSRGVGLDLMQDMIDNRDSANNDISLSGGKVTRTKLLDLINALDEQDVPRENRFFLFPPAREKELLDIDDFIHANKYGSAAALRNGQVGDVYGVPVLITNLFASLTSPGSVVGLHYHTDSEAIGFQAQPEFEEEYQVEKKGWLQSIDQLYGFKTMQQGDMIGAFTSS